jgi:hypothetical protein
MEEYNSTNYLPFELNDKNVRNVNTILKQLKKVILNNKKYNGYMTNYTFLTQMSTFKLPEINVYPVLKNKNLISLTKKNFDISNESTTFLQHKELKEEDKNNNNNIEHNEALSKTQTTQFTAKTQQLYKQYRRNMKNHNSDKLTLVHHNNINSSNMHNNNRLDIFKMVDITSNSQSNINYNQEYITQRDSFKDLLKEKILELASGIIDNDTTNMTKIFNQNSDEQINLSLTSFQIIMKNITNEKESKTFYLPFSIIPVFYYTNIEVLKYFLSKIIKFKNNEMIVDFQCFKEEIKNCEQIILKYEDLSKTLPNEIKFDWIVDETVYEFNVKMPILKFVISGVNFTFEKIVEKDLLIYLYLKNFVLWDNYCINYLSFYKVFRDDLKKIFNRRTNRNSFENSKINIDNYKENLSSTLNPDSHNYEFFYTDTDGITNYFRLSSYIIDLRVETFKVKNRYFMFNTNFHDLNILNKIKENSSIENFIRRNLIIDLMRQKASITFNDIPNGYLKINNPRENMPQDSLKENIQIHIQ